MHTMKSIPVKWIVLPGIVFVCVLGTLSHFFYEWSGHLSFVGLFSPVNESVWEHMKLLFFPMLLYTVYVYFTFRTSIPFIQSILFAGILVGTFLIPTLFYTYSGILGKHIAAVDIAIFYVSVLCAFMTVTILLKNLESIASSCEPAYLVLVKVLLAAAIVLLFIGFVVFTDNPPALGIFKAP
ncbi:MAG: DUF6512 family protein [Lachnospiraceae bacterium]